MKLRRILWSAAVVIPLLASAELPFSNEAFGRVEGTLDFCAKADPAATTRYQERKKSMAGDVTDKELAEARGSKEYKDAYEWTRSKLGEVPKDQAVKACKAFLEGRK